MQILAFANVELR